MSEKGDANVSWTIASLLSPSSSSIVDDVILNVSSSFENATGSGNGTQSEVEERAVVRTVITIVACTVVILGTLLGNFLICGAVAITRRLRTPSNLLIVSLAISDFLVGALDMPFAVLYEVTGRWSIGQVMCDFWTSIDVLFCTASILNICVISVDRYLAITKPFEYAMKRTPVRMFLMIGLVWVVSAVISIPPLFGWKKPPTPNECMVSQEMSYQIFATIGAFYLPLVIMVVIYSRIYLVSSRLTVPGNARLSGASINRPQGVAVQCNGNGHQSPPGDDARVSLCSDSRPDEGAADVLNGRRNGHLAPLMARSVTLVTQLTALTATRRKSSSSRTNSVFTLDAIFRTNAGQRGARGGGRGHERKATRTLGVIMGAFVACWLPFFILALIRPFCHDPGTCIPQWLNSLLLWLGYTNSLLNPVIYARFNREFRTPFKYILQCRCSNINSHLRSEDFTEQFGRFQVNHHGSLYPPPPSLIPPSAAPSSVVVRPRCGSSTLSQLAPLSVIPPPVTPSIRSSPDSAAPEAGSNPSVASHPDTDSADPATTDTRPPPVTVLDSPLTHPG